MDPIRCTSLRRFHDVPAHRSVEAVRSVVGTFGVVGNNAGFYGARAFSPKFFGEKHLVVHRAIIVGDCLIAGALAGLTIVPLFRMTVRGDVQNLIRVSLVPRRIPKLPQRIHGLPIATSYRAIGVDAAGLVGCRNIIVGKKDYKNDLSNTLA